MINLNIISLIYSYLLLASAVVFCFWGTAGFIEYFTGQQIIIPLQNPNFPMGTQFIHWFLITLKGFVFLIGYLKRWQYTPHVMVLLYACLATMCFIQTIDFMTREDRYTSYATELISYTIASLYLFKSKRMQKHFKGS